MSDQRATSAVDTIVDQVARVPAVPIDGEHTGLRARMLTEVDGRPRS